MRGLLAAALLATACPAAAQELVVTFGGDVNFAPSRVAPVPDRINGVPLAEATAWLAGEWASGDVNFINVETAVSERNGEMQGKTFVFRSHPENFRFLIDLGVNAFALANNHAYDHGWTGLADTRAFFDGVGTPILHAGVGRGADAFAPSVIEVNGLRVALGAIGIGNAGFAPTETRVGQAVWGVPAHYDAVLQGLASVEADLRLLSIHSGTENQITLDWRQAEDYRRALDEAGVHLVLGHHPHVARGVEARVGAAQAIWYSLGNLMMAGAAAREGRGLGYDYGLFGRAYFSFDEGTPRLTAMEAVPLRLTHVAPEPLGPDRVRAILGQLNELSRRTSGEAAVRFEPLGFYPDRGAACFGGPYGPDARALCCQIERGPQCDLPALN